MYENELLNELVCLQERKWWFFILSSIFTWIAAISAVLICRLILWACSRIKSPQSAPDDPIRSKEQQNVEEREKLDEKRGFIIKVERWSRDVITCKITELLLIILSIVTFCIYLIDTENEYVELCTKFGDSTIRYVDFAAHIFFLAHFVIRFMAATDKLLFMVETMSFVDFFTIPPFFASIYLQRTYIGKNIPCLRFLRAIQLYSTVVGSKYLNVLLKSAHSKELAGLMSMFVSTVLTAAGVFHLLENSGDPFEFANSQMLSYWTCVYFVLTTMTTVGFGDVFCVTRLGRICMCVFLFVGPTLFVILMFRVFCRTNNGGKDRESSGIRPANNNDQLISAFDCPSTYAKSKSSEDRVVNAISHFIAANELPFGIIEQKSFQSLIETLVPGFVMPSRNTFFASTNTPNEMTKSDVKSVDFVSTSLRRLTSPDQDISFTFSFISSEWELVRRTIVSRKLTATPTADDVSQLICETLDEFNIPIEKMCSMTTDASTDLVNGVKNLGICHIPNLTQLVRTFVEDILSMKEVNGIMYKIDKVFMELECSTEAQYRLKISQKAFNESHNELQSYSKKRCLTTLNKMDFIRGNEIAFQNFLTTYASGKYSDLLLSTVEHQKLESLLNLLSSMEEYIELTTNGTIVTASLANKFIKKIKNTSGTFTPFDTQIKSFVAKLMSAVPEGHHFELAEYFDPRISIVTENLESILVVLKADFQTLSTMRSGLETLFDDESDVDDAYQSLNEEFVLYNSRKKISNYENPLLWWKSKAKTFPIMSRICKKYLSIK